jgi:hypothetical protein
MNTNRGYYDVAPTGETYSVRRVTCDDEFKAVVLQSGLTYELAELYKYQLIDAFNDGVDHAKAIIREHLLSTLCL